VRLLPRFALQNPAHRIAKLKCKVKYKSVKLNKENFLNWWLNFIALLLLNFTENELENLFKMSNKIDGNEFSENSENGSKTQFSVENSVYGEGVEEEIGEGGLGGCGCEGAGVGRIGGYTYRKKKSCINIMVLGL